MNLSSLPRYLNLGQSTVTASVPAVAFKQCTIIVSSYPHFRALQASYESQEDDERFSSFTGDLFECGPYHWYHNIMWENSIDGNRKQRVEAHWWNSSYSYYLFKIKQEAPPYISITYRKVRKGDGNVWRRPCKKLCTCSLILYNY